MAAYVRLLDKKTKEAVKFQDIDDKLRKLFHQPEDKVHWLWHWYDVICFSLAVGHSFQYIRENVLTEDEDEDIQRLILITHWLEGRYDVESWYAR